MQASAVIRVHVRMVGRTRRYRTRSGSAHRTAYCDPFPGGAGNPPQAASTIRASASQIRAPASNARYAVSRGADTRGMQSRSRPFGRLRRRAGLGRRMHSPASPVRAIPVNGLGEHGGNLGRLPGLGEREPISLAAAAYRARTGGASTPMRRGAAFDLARTSAPQHPFPVPLHRGGEAIQKAPAPAAGPASGASEPDGPLRIALDYANSWLICAGSQ
jgi:hypothetical protein